MVKIKEHDGWWLMITKVLKHYIVLHKTEKIIGIEKFDNTKILIDTDDELPNDIALNKVMTLVTCVNKEDKKLYLQPFLDHAL